MDDKELKDLLRKDHSIPKQNPFEWTRIQSEISKPKPSLFFPVMTGLASLSFVFFLSLNFFPTQNQSLSEEEKAAIFDYFEDEAESEELIAWSDD